MNLNRKKIAIVGLGLMGGSLALALRKRFPRIVMYGISRSPHKIRQAKARRIIQRGSCDLASLLAHENINIFIIATPVSVISKMIKTIDRYARNKPIVTDLGSTKKAVHRSIQSLHLKKVDFVGSHPMAGSHETGLAAARHDLYRNSFCFITKTARTSPGACRTVKSLWHSLRVRTIDIAPERHDKIVSKVSHLPHVIALLLIDAVTRQGNAILRFASTGFFDTTRIAQSEANIWIDIVLSNKKNILADLKRFNKSVAAFKKYLTTSQKRRLRLFLHNTAEKRRKYHA